MRLEQSFEVPVPVAQAWGVLLDLEQVAPCMPGAALTEFDGDTFAGNVKVSIGPVSLTYRGTGRFTEKDEFSRRLSLVASGQDTRGAGGAQVRVTAVLHAASGGATTLVKVVADLDIAGKAAQFGRGMIADVSAKLVKQFADSLAVKISSSAPVRVLAPVAAAPSPVSASPVSAPPVTAPVAAAPVLAPVAVPPPPPPLAPVTVELPPPPPPVIEEPVAVESVIEEPVAVEPVIEEPVIEEPVIEEPVAVESVEPVVVEPAAPAFAFTPPPDPAPYVPEPEPTSFGIAPETETHPEYHPLALAEPDATPSPTPEPAVAAALEPEPEPAAAAEPAATPASVYAYDPDPIPVPDPIPGPGPTHAPGAVAPAPQAVEAEPIDLLALTGTKSTVRRAVPVFIIVGLALVALVIWLVTR